MECSDHNMYYTYHNPVTRAESWPKFALVETPTTKTPQLTPRPWKILRSEASWMTQWSVLITKDQLAMWFAHKWTHACTDTHTHTHTHTPSTGADSSWWNEHWPNRLSTSHVQPRDGCKDSKIDCCWFTQDRQSLNRSVLLCRANLHTTHARWNWLFTKIATKTIMGNSFARSSN